MIYKKTVLYISIAWENDPSYGQCAGWFKKTYRPIKRFEMCTDLKAVSDLSRYSAVFIGGGNTFKLLKEIKDSQFDHQIIRYLHDGGFVYGGSAGSIIFGKDILCAACDDVNTVGLEDFKGLNLVKGFNLCCHYVNGGEANTPHGRTPRYGTATIALPENCAVYVEDEAITFLGSGGRLFMGS